MMRKLTWKRVAAWRAARHYLDRRARAGSMIGVAGRLCGLHAQVMSCAELAAWTRVEDLKRGAVQRALWEDRSLIKAWAMRGTLHLLPSREFPMWIAALGASRRYRKPAFWQRCFGITMEELDSLTEAIGKALMGGLTTREELAEKVEQITGSKTFREGLSQSWGLILRPAAYAGYLCFAPSRGQRVQFTHPGAWLGALPPADAGDATRTIARRYLAAYGPATNRDLAQWWGGGGIAGARHWIASLGNEAIPVDVEGQQAWMLAADSREFREFTPGRSVRLLPGFDPYVVAASAHAESLMTGGVRRRIYRLQGWISPVLLVNGMMAGVWKHETARSRVIVTIEPFTKPAAWVQRAAEEEAERLAAFLGGALELSFKTAS